VTGRGTIPARYAGGSTGRSGVLLWRGAEGGSTTRGGVLLRDGAAGGSTYEVVVLSRRGGEGEYGVRSGTTPAIEGGISRVGGGDTAVTRRVVPGP
jgi:hypothetical protein